MKVVAGEGVTEFVNEHGGARGVWPVQLFDHSGFDAPEHLHLVVKRFLRRRVDAFWDSKIFVDADLPEEMGGRG